MDETVSSICLGFAFSSSDHAPDPWAYSTVDRAKTPLANADAIALIAKSHYLRSRQSQVEDRNSHLLEELSADLFPR